MFLWESFKDFFLFWEVEIMWGLCLKFLWSCDDEILLKSDDIVFFWWKGFKFWDSIIRLIRIVLINRLNYFSVFG